jgi:uncharacterized damage-inducible protein DinB
MEMKTYLTYTFHYNDFANTKLFEKIKLLPDNTEAIKFFNHLINSQNKWMARIRHEPAAMEMSWWDPVYAVENLIPEWKNSLQLWLNYLNTLTEEQLSTEIEFTGFDGGKWAATPADIALQLNYHSIHHRAQMQTMIRQQGLEPDFLDYIGTRYRKIE